MAYFGEDIDATLLSWRERDAAWRQEVVELLLCAADIGMSSGFAPLLTAAENLGASHGVVAYADISLRLMWREGSWHQESADWRQDLALDCLELAARIDDGLWP